MHLITAASGPNDPSPSAPKVRVRAFNVNSSSWPRRSLAWLKRMKNRGLGFTEAHTLALEGAEDIAQFIVFVCAATQSPTPPISVILDHWRYARFGNLVHVDCEKSPPLIRVHEDFWAGPSEGESHFERLVRPLMDKLISGFGEEEPWAS